MTVMSEFFRRLERYINKNSKNPIEEAPHFKFGETSYLAPEIALEIYSVYKQRDTLQGMWNKECDYNRLLRQENSDLKEELDSFYEDNMEDVDDPIPEDKNQEKEYLS